MNVQNGNRRRHPASSRRRDVDVGSSRPAGCSPLQESSPWRWSSATGPPPAPLTNRPPILRAQAQAAAAVGVRSRGDPLDRPPVRAHRRRAQAPGTRLAHLFAGTSERLDSGRLEGGDVADRALSRSIRTLGARVFVRRRGRAGRSRRIDRSSDSTVVPPADARSEPPAVRPEVACRRVDADDIDAGRLPRWGCRCAICGRRGQRLDHAPTEPVLGVPAVRAHRVGARPAAGAHSEITLDGASYPASFPREVAAPVRPPQLFGLPPSVLT